MEVHHPHSSHEKKTFKHYILEFLTLFLAVTMGFIAENIREHRVEKHREKEFMQSMVKEMKSDSMQMRQVLQDTIRISKLDSLSVLLLSDDYSPNTIKKIYELDYYAMGYDAMIFNRNTLTQLKNAGNMRLIRKQSVVDSLNVLDNKITSVNDQLEAQRQIILRNYEDIYSIFDESYFIENGKRIKRKDAFALHRDMKLLTNDKILLHKYGGKVGIQSGITKIYFYMLKNVYDYQNRLIPFIEKEYHLKN